MLNNVLSLIGHKTTRDSSNELRKLLPLLPEIVQQSAQARCEIGCDIFEQKRHNSNRATTLTTPLPS